MKTGIELIAEERKEQIDKHGFNHEQDAEYYAKQELVAAAQYALRRDHWTNLADTNEKLAERFKKLFEEYEAELERVKAVAEKMFEAFKEVRDNAAEAGEIMFGPKSIDYFDKILEEYENLKT